MPQSNATPAGEPLKQMTPADAARLRALAQQASTHAYAPYSHLNVGAAVMVESGEVFTGCNVENASYGLTVCAERAAVFAAVSALGPTVKLQSIAIFADAPAGSAPCGACRQVISEFGQHVTVTYRTRKGWKVTTSGHLLPDSFKMDV